ncbi:MAG TPA: tetratricopeptide repeat protein [Terriglobia bacterium]|nr:tetratricopeptide repeat protein [Terriglobia bacterium]
MTGIGNASLRITTKSPEAQAYFNQGLRLLYAFWYFESYRAFRECATLDPSAAMAYWGMAQALANFPTMQEAENAAVEKAEATMGSVSAHERQYIQAAADLAQSQGADGRASYILQMQSIIREYPGDLNAPALLALFMMSGYGADGQAMPGQLYAEELLRGILAVQPDDVAANHLWIHAVEGGPSPKDGLKSAEIVARLAPASGHLVHMLGHVYFRLGDYEKAREAFLHSMSVDEAYLASEHIPPQDDSNYEHNLSYLAADCSEEGRYHEALKWAQKLDGLRASPVYWASALNYSIPVGSTLLRVHLRYGDWLAAARDSTDFGVDAAQLGIAAREYEQGWHLYARGMAELESDRDVTATSRADQNSLALDTLLDDLQKRQQREPSIAAFWTGGALRLLGIAADELQGSLECAKRQYVAGLKDLESAEERQQELGYTEPPYYACPVEETIGNVYLAMHAWNLAREAFRQELRLRPRSGFALFGIAESYEMEGRDHQATQEYESFLAAWPHADPGLPQVSKAKAWLAAHP